MRHTLYSNCYYDEDQYGKTYEDYCRQDYFEIYSEEYGWDTIEDIDEDKFMNYMYMCLDDDLFIFETEMKEFLKSRTLLVSGSLGLWDGTQYGYDIIYDIDDFKKYLGYDLLEIYEDNGHLYIEGTHHDGTNRFELLELTDKGRALIENDYYGELDINKIAHCNFYTRLPYFRHHTYGCEKTA